MRLKFTTVSGSVYELDTTAKKVRRTECPSRRPSSHLSEEWAPFLYYSNPVQVGFSTSFAWPDGDVTTTSVVTKVEK